MNAKELFQAGQLDEAIAAAVEQVKQHPTDIGQRSFLCSAAVLRGQRRAGGQATRRDRQSGAEGGHGGRPVPPTAPRRRGPDAVLHRGTPARVRRRTRSAHQASLGGVDLRPRRRRGQGGRAVGRGPAVPPGRLRHVRRRGVRRHARHGRPDGVVLRGAHEHGQVLLDADGDRGADRVPAAGAASRPALATRPHGRARRSRRRGLSAHSLFRLPPGRGRPRFAWGVSPIGAAATRVPCGVSGCGRSSSASRPRASWSWRKSRLDVAELPEGDDEP